MVEAMVALVLVVVGLFSIVGYLAYQAGVERGRTMESASKLKLLFESEPESDLTGYLDVGIQQYFHVRPYAKHVLDNLRTYPWTLVIHPGGEARVIFDQSRHKQPNGKRRLLDEIRDTEELKNVKPLTVGEADELSKIVREADPEPKHFRTKGKVS